MPPLHRHDRRKQPPPTLWVDIDDTLLNFSDAHPAGVRAVERWARASVNAPPEKAQKLAGLFDRAFQAGLSGWHGGASVEFARLQSRLAPRLERIASDGPKPVRWAREIWLELAAEESGLKLSREKICEGTHEYWRALAPAQKLYPDVNETLRELKSRGYDIVLVTSSDCRVVPDNGGWRYDTRKALEWKVARLRDLLGPLVPDVARLFIGDPLEKTSPAFFRAVVEQVPPPEGAFIVAVGDSVESDLKLARAADPAVRYSVLCDPHGRYAGEIPEGVDRRIGQVSELLLLFF